MKNLIVTFLFALAIGSPCKSALASVEDVTTKAQLICSYLKKDSEVHLTDDGYRYFFSLDYRNVTPLNVLKNYFDYNIINPYGYCVGITLTGESNEYAGYFSMFTSYDYMIEVLVGISPMDKKIYTIKFSNPVRLE